MVCYTLCHHEAYDVLRMKETGIFRSGNTYIKTSFLSISSSGLSAWISYSFGICPLPYRRYRHRKFKSFSYVGHKHLILTHRLSIKLGQPLLKAIRKVHRVFNAGYQLIYQFVVLAIRSFFCWIKIPFKYRLPQYIVD